MTWNGHGSKVRYLSRVAFDNVSHPWIKRVVRLSFFMGPRTSGAARQTFFSSSRLFFE